MIVFPIIIAVVSIVSIVFSKNNTIVKLASAFVIILTAVSSVIDYNDSNTKSSTLSSLNNTANNLYKAENADSLQLIYLSNSLKLKIESDKQFEDSLKSQFHIIRNEMNKPQSIRQPIINKSEIKINKPVINSPTQFGNGNTQYNK